MRILLTNDDGIASPLLPFLLAELTREHEVTAVVPATDQSWRGKSMTCFSPVECTKTTLGGVEVFVVSGTPADCANIGVHHLAPAPVDVLVSGINIGLNSGIGFMLSSGTLGACLEANIARLPAVAFSQAMPHEAMARYRASGDVDLGAIGSLRVQGRLIADVFAVLTSERESIGRPWTLSFNFPARWSPDSKVILSRLSHTLYGSAFVRRGGRFVHDLKDVFVETDEMGDAIQLAAGMVTLTPIDLRTLGQTQYGAGHEECAAAAARLGERLNVLSFGLP